MDLHLLVLDIQTQMVIDAHVLVRHPHKRKERNQVTAPVLVQQFEASKNQKRRRNIMAETVFTCEQVEELSSRQGRRIFRLLLAIVARFPKNFLVRYCPCHTGDGYRQNEQPGKLETDRHGSFGCKVQEESPL